MKVKFKLSGQRYEVEFKVFPNQTGLALLAKDSKNLDILQDVISSADAPAHLISTVLQKEIEKQIKLPIDIDNGYNGAGYGFKLDLYSIATMLK